jgi:hypothetical protein
MADERRVAAPSKKLGAVLSRPSLSVSLVGGDAAPIKLNAASTLFFVHSCRAVAATVTVARRSAPDTLICPMAVPVSARRAVTAPTPIGGGSTELTLTLILNVLMNSVRAIRASATVRG